MKPFSAFSAPGRWHRGNCHTHTTLSDGTGTPEAVARAYEEEGYDFLVLTDHNRTQESVAGLTRGRMLVINGIELHPPVRFKPAHSHHLVGIGVEKTPSQAFIKKTSLAGAIRWVIRNGGIPVYGHPYWTGHDIECMREGRTAFGVEAFNNVCERTRGLGDASAHLDQALTEGIRWKVFATDDTHKLEREAFGGWIVVKAKERTRPAILAAIRRGHFYATQGPVIKSVRVHRGVAYAECSPVRKITWHARGPAGTVTFAAPQLLTHSELPLKRVWATSKYVRLEITDARGFKAWSNPIWWDPIRKQWSD